MSWKKEKKRHLGISSDVVNDVVKAAYLDRNQNL